MKKQGGFFEAVYSVVEKIPKGYVATYGDIAKIIGRPKMSRYVGYALHSNPYPDRVLCYKIVDRFGRLAKAFVFGGQQVQKQLLEAEGVEVSEDFTVDLDKYRIKLQ